MVLNNGKIVGYFTNHWNATVSNIIIVYILFGMREQMAIVKLCVSPVLTQIKTLGILWHAHFE